MTWLFFALSFKNSLCCWCSSLFHYIIWLLVLVFEQNYYTRNEEKCTHRLREIWFLLLLLLSFRENEIDIPISTRMLAFLLYRRTSTFSNCCVYISSIYLSKSQTVCEWHAKYNIENFLLRFAYTEIRVFIFVASMLSQFIQYFFLLLLL